MKSIRQLDSLRTVSRRKLSFRSAARAGARRPGEQWKL